MDVTRFCENSTAHGLRKIASAKSRLKQTFWSATFTAAVILLLIHLYLRLGSYLRFQHQEITYTLYEPEIQYPDVTVCNINPFTSSTKLHEQQLREKYLEDPLHLNGSCRYENHSNVHNSSRSYMEALATTAGLDVVANLTLQKSDFIIQCSFMSTSCSPDDFHTFIDIQYYQCHTISLNKLISRLAQESKKPEPGGEFGLSLILYVDAASRNSSQNSDGINNFQTSTLNTAGVRVAVHSEGTRPHLQHHGFDVSAGFSSGIALEPHKHSRLKYPYKSNCTDTIMIDSDIVYTQDDCMDFCIFQKVESACGCLHISAPMTSSSAALPICGQDICNTSDWDCYYRMRFDDESSRCVESCPHRCSDHSYVVKLSSSYWPGDDFQPSFYASLFTGSNDRQLLTENLGPATNETIDLLMADDLIRKNFLRLNIYMETFYVRYTEEEELYDLVVLLSDFGGTLGLWVGISILSVIEILEFITITIAKKIKQYYNNCRRSRTQ